MKKSTLKKLSALTSTCILVAMLAGCGQNATEGSSSDATSQSSSGTQESAPYALKIFGTDFWGNTGRYDDMDAVMENNEVMKRWAAMLAEQNITLEWEVVLEEQYTTAAQTRLASGNNLPDFMYLEPLGYSTITSLGMSGTLLPVNKIIEEYSPDGNAANFFENEKPWAMAATLSPNGESYFLSNTYEVFSKLPGEEPVPCDEPLALLIRRDWVEELGKELPTTLDEFTELLYAFRSEDMNGNGKADEVINLIDMGMGIFTSGIAQSFGLVGGLTGPDPAQDDKITSPWLQPGIRPYIEYIKQLVEDEIVLPETLSYS